MITHQFTCPRCGCHTPIIKQVLVCSETHNPNLITLDVYGRLVVYSKTTFIQCAVWGCGYSEHVTDLPEWIRRHPDVFQPV